MTSPTSVTAGTRLARLLQLVPWLLARPGVPLTEAAAHFEVTPAQLVSDLDLLVCSGPGQQHGELLDIWYWPDDDAEDGLGDVTITVQDPQSLTRPLRLTGEEAAALLVGLRLLAQVPGTHDRDVIARVTETLEEAAGSAAAAGDAVDVSVRGGGDAAVTDLVEAAVRDSRALRIRYAGAARDQESERVVDPITVLAVDGQPYLSAWCRTAEATRTFRLDRILGAELTGEAAAVPEDASPPDLGAGGLRPAGPPVTLDLRADARWVAEEYPVDATEERPDGTLRVTLPVADPQWLVRLALRLGPRARVVSPADLAAQVAVEARTALAAYSDAPGDE